MADSAQVDELRRTIQGRTFDEEPLAGMNAEALDFRAAAECFAELRRLQKGDLRNLQLVTVHQGRASVTIDPTAPPPARIAPRSGRRHLRAAPNADQPH